MSVPLTVRCECGEVIPTNLGDRVDCTCGRHYDTSSLAAEQFVQVRAHQSWARLYVQLGFVFVAAVSVVTAMKWGFRGIAVGLPLSGMIWFRFIRRWFYRTFIPSPGKGDAVNLEASDPVSTGGPLPARRSK